MSRATDAIVYEIQKKSVRAELRYRPEPYWKQLGYGQHIGYRVGVDGRTYWLAKFRSKTIKRQTHPLGECIPEFEYDQAKVKAESWFKDLIAAHAQGVVLTSNYTVEQACADYVDDRRIERGDVNAEDKRTRIKGGITPFPIAKMRCVDVMSEDLRKFRNASTGTKRTKNQKLKLLRSVLRCAVRHKKVAAEKLVEWDQCPLFANDQLLKEGPGRREVYLTLPQRRALIAEVSPDVAELLKATGTSGGRPGEIGYAQVKQYDRSTGQFTFIGKTGERTRQLSPQARKLFDAASRLKLPNAYLFTQANGERWEAWMWCREIKRAVRKLGLSLKTVLYTFRHCFITDQLTEGALTPLEVAKYCGTSLQMINDNYGHLTEGHIERLDRVAMI
jgi:integrase